MKKNQGLNEYFLHSNFKFKWWTPKKIGQKMSSYSSLTAKWKDHLLLWHPPCSGFLGGMVAYSYANFVGPSVFSQRPYTMRWGSCIFQESSICSLRCTCSKTAREIQWVILYPLLRVCNKYLKMDGIFFFSTEIAFDN